MSLKNLTCPFRICHAKQRTKGRKRAVVHTLCSALQHLWACAEVKGFRSHHCKEACHFHAARARARVKGQTGEKRTAKEWWFRSDVCVWGGGGCKPRWRTEDSGPLVFPEVTGISHLRYCLMAEEWIISILNSSCLLCRRQMWPAHQCMCVCVISVCVSANMALGPKRGVSRSSGHLCAWMECLRASHHGCAASGTSVLHLWTPS